MWTDDRLQKKNRKMIPGPVSRSREGWITPTTGIGVSLLLILSLTAELSSARSICPARDDQPCECQAKKDGVVLVCEKTKITEVEKGLKFFREKGGIVINYLTIRQSHVARIPNGFFMGMCILLPPNVHHAHHSVIRV